MHGRLPDWLKPDSHGRFSSWARGGDGLSRYVLLYRPASVAGCDECEIHPRARWVRFHRPSSSPLSRDSAVC